MNNCILHLELNSFGEKKKKGKRPLSRWVAVIEEITTRLTCHQSDMPTSPWPPQAPN